MPLRVTSAPVAGVQKRRRKPADSKPRASPFAGHARRKATTSRAPDLEDEETDSLPDVGLSRYIPETAPVENVVQALAYIRDSVFDEIPQRAGMNSTRIAEVLNFRRSLPPLVSVAHVHTLLDAPTRVEKEVMELVSQNRVRRLVVPGRGNDAAGLGDCLVLVEDWERLVRDSNALDAALKDKFLSVLKQIGNTSAVPGILFSPPEHTSLVRAGFLVSSSSLAKGSSNMASLPSLPTSTTNTAGNPASRSSSGSDSPRPHTPLANRSHFHTATLFLSLPNTGPYLRLLGAGRTHLLTILRKSSAREIPLSLLRDRWNGAVETETGSSVAKRMRGEFTGVLPGRTKKWKDLYGMQFRWVLEEAVGAGLVELFDTGSVGPGVRCL
ncbi:serine-threonine protein kinase 19-domain-containing protein [Aspergillus taichungensis]|uniref:Serine-threonine protein kinase 19-domain-containing protein n=1 Tax=Aspergillus taichungensis TaxID=482145 RepID=A0A2J5HMP1_9EURO|nr:serine-threonine protein kinase 19-domain-containing protein [Aspergillus taichungensis]